MTKELIRFSKSAASGSGSGNFLKNSPTLRDRAFFYNLAYITADSKRIFMQILSQTQIYPWTIKSLLNFGANLVARIRIRTPDRDQILLGEGIRSLTLPVLLVTTSLIRQPRHNRLYSRLYLAFEVEASVNEQFDDVVIWNVTAGDGDVQRFREGVRLCRVCTVVRAVH